jgi:aspartate/methionine/tyrosine aminotransferase
LLALQLFDQKRYAGRMRNPGNGYAHRLEDIQPFLVMELISKARALEMQGRDIVHMEVGEPDFETPEPVAKAGRRAIAEGHTKYTSALGIGELREAISEFYRRRLGVSVDPERIVVTAGASGALLLAASLLIDPGRGLLMTDPGYPCNRQFLRLLDGEGQLVPVTGNDNFQLTPSHLDRFWRDNTVGILLATPSNPTGAVLSREELRALSGAVRNRNGYLVVDEIYQGLTYEAEPFSVLEVDEDAFVINSFSKYFGMTGWRVGWLVAPRAAIPDLEKLSQNLFISPSAIAQHAALSALDEATVEILERRRLEFRQRRDFLSAELRRLGFGLANTPGGAFYLYAEMSRFGPNSYAFCEQMLGGHGVAITPGADFGFHRPDRYVRFAYTTGMDRLQEAVRRLERALA